MGATHKKFLSSVKRKRARTADTLNSACRDRLRHLATTPAIPPGTVGAFCLSVIFRFTLLFLLILAANLPAHADDLSRDVLNEINLARRNPAKYAEIVAGTAATFRGSEGPKAVREAVKFLRKAKALSPLAWSEGIGQAALTHALDIGPRGGNGHRGAGGETPWKRMERFGTWRGYAGENIDYGHSDARSIVISLIVDNGVPSRHHRANLFSKNFRVAGIAVASHARCGTLCVIDFATSFVEAGTARVAARSDAGYRSKYSGMSFF